MPDPDDLRHAGGVSRPTGRPAPRQAPQHAPQHSLGPHVVGQRVVVRRLVPGEQGPSGGPAMTDVLGVCTAWGDGRCVVLRDDGSAVEIALADVVSGKPVPPRPSVRHRVPARAVEGHVLSLWDDVRTEPVGEWLLRTSDLIDGRHPRRANSVLAVGDPGLPVVDASRGVVRWYADRGRPAQAHVVEGSPEQRALLDVGWTPLGSGSAHCQLASVAQSLRHGPAVPDGLELGEEGHRATAVLPGARGRAALDGDWVGIHGLLVDPPARRAGLGRQVLAGLLDWAAARGATTAWLHVEVDNGPALGLYERAGFRTHHSLAYLSGPATH